MAHDSVAELFDSIADTRARIYESIQGLSLEQARFRLSDDRWSVADIAEHLSLTESRLAQLVKSLVEQGASQAAALDEGKTVAPISVEYAVSQVGEKAEAPPPLKPSGALSLDESIENLRRTRAAILSLRDELESKDYSRAICTHASFGELNPYQLVAFIGAHEERHLKQIGALVGADSFPGRAASA